MAYDVQAALERTGIPAYRSAYRRGEDGEMAEGYVVYAVQQTPIDFFDDRPHGMIHRPILHLCTRGDPLALSDRIDAEMMAEGFTLNNRQDAYDQDADLYITETEWQGVERDGY